MINATIGKGWETSSAYLDMVTMENICKVAKMANCGLMEAKKALTATNGDVKKALLLLSKK